MSEVCKTGKSRLQLSGVLISLRRLFAFLEVKTRNRDFATVTLHAFAEKRAILHSFGKADERPWC